MKTTKIIVLVFGTLISLKSFACICKFKKLPELQKLEFENSESIFIGEVVEIDTLYRTFKIKVLESFSVDVIGTVYNGSNDKFCGPTVNEKGKWLIYGNFNAENLLEINTCGLTRSFEHPENNISVTRLPIPPPSNTKESESQVEKRKKERKLRTKSDLEKEIALLRKRTQ
ncbi:hypothetical protein KIM67_08800 [Flagellimonas sp. 389]|uniref:hypothetical protein n=1 Tax=Flagellimonas sp. 389 TaxID=2835862 RepID=UPI001BD49384|nr:hypothetical protein [Flagellimonas sp. 389]MBS9462507.1 hypothetical protein [Flagellimonas sp. 389]